MDNERREFSEERIRHEIELSYQEKEKKETREEQISRIMTMHEIAEFEKN